MALPQSAYKDRQFLAVIGDEVRAVHPPRQPACPLQSTNRLNELTRLTEQTGLSNRHLARGRRRTFSSPTPTNPLPSKTTPPTPPRPQDTNTVVAIARHGPAGLAEELLSRRPQDGRRDDRGRFR